ncbi:transcriptional regulator, RpiR family [Amphibacillus marinus]|uniref:Transcriptional regulator, RpiR family n=1 Tax=Amphibacillus marinus TaxID=872970 RepID=A0A1H8M828_9BACI|nr:MurR/RpiR family transcriptional regulator [Amphibacillus marinus]SEO13483.1 transcriptional regulator, RpiR family [Amphibacillus marinus]
MFTSQIISSFNDLEMGIYHYICQNIEKVAYMRIRELADATHVSTATILRFCKKLNCEGFSEFKTKLKMELQEGKKQPIKSSQHAILEFFERTLHADRDEQIGRAASLVSDAENVIFIGNGSSGILAEYGARYFSGLGKFSTYIKDFSYPLHAKLKNKSVTIALSVSGENPFTISQVNKLKQEGSKIVSITNNKLSTIAKISDVNISYYITEEFNLHTNVTTQVPVIFLIETIAREIYQL